MNILAPHDRREFLRSAGKLAIGGFASMAIAQQVPKPPAGRRPQRVAVIGVGHYHATRAVLSPDSSERESRYRWRPRSGPCRR